MVKSYSHVILLVLVIDTICINLVLSKVQARPIAYFRFEDTTPAAYWRWQLVFADHSGYDHHLRFEEEGYNVRHQNPIDGLPESDTCQSPVGQGCTHMEFRGYDADKILRNDWVPYQGVYRSSKSIPPGHMFNMRAASPQTPIQLRQSLTEYEQVMVPAGSGLLSWDCEGTDDNATIYLPVDATVDLTHGFTFEGFLQTTVRDFSLFNRMDIANAAENGTEIFRLSLVNDTLQFFVGSREKQFSVAITSSVFKPYINGKWHYLVARYTKDVYGPMTVGKISLKVLSEDGHIDYAIASTPADFFLHRPTNDKTFKVFFGRSSQHKYKFGGNLDELRLSEGAIADFDLLGKVGASYFDAPKAPKCSGRMVLRQEMGSVTDGSGVNEEYINGLNCEWLLDHSDLFERGIPPTELSKPRMLSFLALTFQRFSTEPDADIVYIYDGNTTSAPLIVALSGYDVPAVPILSTSDQVLVKFVSNGIQFNHQLGFEFTFVAMSLSARVCGTVHESQDLSLSCPRGYLMSKINFASYGTPLGQCSNADPRAGKLMDANGFIYSDNSNPNGFSDGKTADPATGGQDGVVLFKTGFCHSNFSRPIVANKCLMRPSCQIPATDATFGENPCRDFSDSKLGVFGHDNPGVKGQDVYPSKVGPYAPKIAKRLYVQATCDGKYTFGKNCARECLVRGKCLYALPRQFCNFCNKQVGIERHENGTFHGLGCGIGYCVKEANCSSVIRPSYYPSEEQLKKEALEAIHQEVHQEVLQKEQQPSVEDDGSGSGSGSEDDAPAESEDTWMTSMEGDSQGPSSEWT